MSDLRLAHGLDPDKHFTQQKLVTVVAQGETFRVEDITTTRFELYDSLAKIHALMVTLSNNPPLVEFGFLLNWDQLKPEEQRAKYSKYACHELNYFLFRKDPAFFEAVVLPYLKNKRDKTFLDQWLIGADLQGYLEPWKRAQLNVVERILLAQRLADEQPVTRRAIADLVDVMPPDVDRFNFLFNTAVQGSALEAGETLSRAVMKQSEEVRLGVVVAESGRKHPRPPNSVAAGAGGDREMAIELSDSDAERLSENQAAESADKKPARRRAGRLDSGRENEILRGGSPAPE